MRPLDPTGVDAATAKTTFRDEPGQAQVAVQPRTVTNNSGSISDPKLLDIIGSAFGPGPLAARAREQGVTELPEKFHQLDRLFALCESGRIFISEQDALRRASPGEAKERLDAGLPVHVVKVLSIEARSSSSSSSSSYRVPKFASYRDGAEWARESETSAQVSYSASPIATYEALMLESPKGGIKGVAVLPRSGSMVTIDGNYERAWHAEAHAEGGILKIHSSSSQSGGRIVRTNDVKG